MASVETDGEVSGAVDPGNMHTVDTDDTPALATSVDPDEQARDFSQKSWREDLELVVEGRTLHVASNILSLLSPVFTAMFEERFQVAGPRRIQLADKKHGDVVQFLRCLYPNICQQITEDNVYVVLPLADEFKVKQLKKTCEDFLVEVTSSLMSAEVVCKYLQLAFRYDLGALRAKCVKLAANINPKLFASAEKVHPLSQEVKLDVQEMQIEQLLIDKKNNEETCKILKEFMAYEWSNPKGYAVIREAKPAALKLLVSGVSAYQASKSHATTVHGMSWYIYAARKKLEKGDILSVFLHSEPLGDWYKWEVEAAVKVWLLNKESGKHRVREFTHTFSSSSLGGTGRGWDNFISFNELSIGSQFVVKDTFEINVYVLVKEPICNPDVNGNLFAR